MIKTLIIYSSLHGCTARAAELLQKRLGHNITCHNMKDKPNPSIDTYDRVIIGGSIHAGKIQRAVKYLCKKNQKNLLKKQLGLFICCMDQEKALEQYRNAYPELLRNHASAAGLFGGEFNFERMNFVQKAIIKKISGLEASVDKLDEAAIGKFINQLESRRQSSD